MSFETWEDIKRLGYILAVKIRLNVLRIKLRFTKHITADFPPLFISYGKRNVFRDHSISY